MRRKLSAALVAAIALGSVGLGHGLAEAGSVPWGPDVADYQHPGGAPINWGDVRRAGASFGIVKATEGTYYTNPYWASDYANVRRAGMVRGSYEFARPALPISTAVAQAYYLVSRIGNTRQAGDLPPILDLEVTGGLNASQLITWAQTWLDTVRQLTGRAPIVYSYPYFLHSVLRNTNAFTAYPLWIADYNGASRPSMPLPGSWPSWRLWQYTSSARVRGIADFVDVSHFDGSVVSLRGLANGSSPAWPLHGPAAPVGVWARGGAGSASVYWRPSSDGGSRVTYYRVTAHPGGRSVTVPGSAVGVRITRLSYSTRYTFTVTAANAHGRSGSSGHSNVVIPEAPTRLSGGLGARDIAPRRSTVESVRLRRADTGAPVAGHEVTVYVRPHTSRRWVSVGSARTDRSGVARLTLRPSSSEDVYAVFKGGGGYTAAHTGMQTLWLVPGVQAKPNRTSFDLSNTLSVQGRVTPATHGTVILLQDAAGRRWVTVGRAGINRAGSFLVSLRTRRPGRNSMRIVQVPPTRAFRASASRTFTTWVAAPRAAVRGRDNQMYVWISGNWNGVWERNSWARFAGRLGATPVVVTLRGTHYYFAVGPNRKPYVRVATTRWHSASRTSARCLSLAAAAGDNTVWLACVTTRHTLAVGSTRFGRFGLPAVSSWRSLGGSVTGAPAVVVERTGPVFTVLGPTERGHDIWQRSLGHRWQLQPVRCYGAPATAVAGSTLTLACATRSNGELLDASHAGSRWTFVHLSGRFSGRPAVVTSPAGPVFYVVGPNRALYVRTVRTRWNWLSGWVDQGVSAAW